MYDNLLRFAHGKLMMLDDKAARGENIEDYELQCADMLAHMEKSLLTSAAMYGAGDNSRGGMSFADGRGGNSRNSYGYPMPMSYADGRGGDSYGNGYSNMGGGYSAADMQADTIARVNSMMPTLTGPLRAKAQEFVSAMQQYR